MLEEKELLCWSCQYCGDKYSFPLPNELLGIDKNNPRRKHHYCCRGDCERYRQDITYLEIESCECFEEL